MSCNVYIAIVARMPRKIKMDCNLFIAKHEGGYAMQKIRQDCSLGQNIRAMRICVQMTQEQVVAQMQLRGCDISRSIYSQIERGTYNIRVSELIALKEIFRVEFNDFFSGLDLNI